MGWILSILATLCYEEREKPLDQMGPIKIPDTNNSVRKYF